jgi:propanol-preferring alcohol dehydrogenase
VADVETLMTLLPKRMSVMEFAGAGHPLRAAERTVKQPTGRNLLIRVGACGICRTDLHVIDGDLKHPKANVIPGHEVIGRVAALGPDARGFKVGDRVGVPWLGFTCGRCRYCRSGRENLCEKPKFTGYTLDGGYAEYVTADSHYSFLIPEGYTDAEAAPLMCAGLIGYRCWKLVRSAQRLGIYGFGAAAHIVCQVAVAQGRRAFAFTRAGDAAAQALARELGAAWAGASDELPPEPLDAALVFAPAGALVPAALRALAPGGTVVCAGIHMSDIPSFPYELLWRERSVRSVANLTRADGIEFLELAPRVPVRTRVTEYPLPEAQRALEDLRAGRFAGAAVVVP